MKIWLMVGIGLTVLYGGLLVISGVGQLKGKELSTKSSVSTIIIGLLIVLTSVLLVSDHRLVFGLLISLFMMHIQAVINGYQLYKKIHLMHHLLRLIITISLLLLVFKGMKS